MRHNQTSGAYLDTYIREGSGGLKSASDLAFDSSGLLYVSSFSTNQVLRYEPSPVFNVEDEFFFDVFEVAQNYPNPFKHSTAINYNLLKGGVVKIAVYDILGREVVELTNEIQPAGTHLVAWLPDAGVPAGLYMLRIIAPEGELVLRMLKMR
ncbi:MAG: T9SS type A sorting domain-containing protein [Rhodothermales bacterium]